MLTCTFTHQQLILIQEKPCTWCTVQTPFIIVMQVWIKDILTSAWHNATLTDRWSQQCCILLAKKQKKTLKGCVSFLLFHSAYTLKSTLLTQGDHQPLLTWPAGPYTHHITPSAMSPAHETTVSALGSKKELHEHSRSNKGVRSIFFSLDNEFHISEGKLTLPSSWMYLNARSLPEKPITECCERSRVSVCMCMYAFVVLWLHGGS